MIPTSCATPLELCDRLEVRARRAASVSGYPDYTISVPADQLLWLIEDARALNKIITADQAERDCALALAGRQAGILELDALVASLRAKAEEQLKMRDETRHWNREPGRGRRHEAVAAAYRNAADMIEQALRSDRAADGKEDTSG